MCRRFFFFYGLGFGVQGLGVLSKDSGITMHQQVNAENP